VAVALLAAIYFWPPSRPAGPQQPGLPVNDPRLAYRGPFRNVQPEVAYVPESLCADCHAAEAKTYRRHPMARTLLPANQAPLPPLTAAVHNPFTALGQRFEVVSRGDRLLHTRSAFDESGSPLFRHEIEVDFAIGSGTHAYSYLAVRGSTVLQTPITWFAEKRRWDLSPGFEPNVLAGRRIGADCLFCHSNGANEDPGQETTYRQPLFPNGHGIGCQRCHGPGGEHVQTPGTRIQTEIGFLDPTIVNPRYLSPHLRESICWQCHLEGDVRVLRRGRGRFDFRPGLPLEDFIGVFVDGAETTFEEVTNHVEQMMQSRCYQKRPGPEQMGCVTCHDPHEKPPPDRRVSHYRQACLKCHAEEACSLPRPQRLAQHRDDSCIACHMPTFASSNIAHVSSTDHRIPRRASPRKRDHPPSLRRGAVQDLVSVFPWQRGQSDAELDRDRALAGAILARRGRKLVHPLDRELEQAAQRDPGDLLVRAQYGLELINKDEVATALPILEDVLARQPDNEWALLGQALGCGQLGRVEEALSAWRLLVKLAPSHRGYHVGLIELLLRQRRWQDAEQEARDWLAVDPGSPEGHALLRDALFQLGRGDEAKIQDRIVQGLNRH
jgi:Flp pilus assembly protein TadD